jgi:hypothetical protein
MITCIIGQTGSGKTWLMTRLLYDQYRYYNAKIVSCYPLHFPEDAQTSRFWQLSDLYSLSGCVIGFDELQKLLNAKNWASLPVMFMDLICQHRHSAIDIYGTTQDLAQIDISLRRNIHELFVCQTIVRFPINERVKPFFHWIRVVKKKRRFDVATDRLAWEKVGRAKWYFISRFWTRTLYDTYSKTRLTKYLTWTKRKDKKWTTVIANRQLVAAGKVRR